MEVNEHSWKSKTINKNQLTIYNVDENYSTVTTIHETIGNKSKNVDENPWKLMKTHEQFKDHE